MVEVIADLCHFGVPDWVGGFQNPDFPLLFAHYAQCFAQRYPWVRYYTPVNEPLITCLFSDLFGWWNSQGTTDKSFVRAIANVVKANTMAMQAILSVRPDARFVMAEAHEFTHAECDKGERDAAIKNERRFITFDLCLSHPVSHRMREYMLDNGMSEAEHRWFMDDKGLKPHCIIGADYYVTSEGMIHSNGETSFAEDVCGYHELSRQYHDRYKLPIMLSETNMAQGERGDEAVKWLRQQWRQLRFSKRHHGVPQVGLCWYSLTDQTDWDCALREKNGTVNPLGLYDLDRNIRPVGRAFKELIAARA
jgi:beta-glucosidase